MGVTSFDAFQSREFWPFVFCLLVAQLWLTVCDPMDCSWLGSSVHGIFQARVWSGLPFFLQGIFQTQGLNPGLRR